MSRFEEGVEVGKLQLIAENYYTNVIKPKVLKGEENEIFGKERRLIPTAYREIIDEQKEEIQRLNNIIDELEKDIQEDNQKAREYMKKVEQSGMCQGDYPVHYYYADKRIGLTEKYLERLKELKEGK